MRVLLVEDYEHLGRMLTEGLRHEGFSVEWVRDGYSAVNHIPYKQTFKPPVLPYEPL